MNYEDMTKEQLIELLKEKDSKNIFADYEEERITEESYRYEAKLEEIGYIDYGSGIECYGPY